MKEFMTLARDPAIIRRALRVALIVGTILTLINQGDQLVAGHGPGLLKALLTYLVPYCVSTHGAVSALRESRRNGRSV